MHKEEPTIQVKGISKKYVIRHETAPYKTFQEAIINAVKAPLRLIKNNGGLPQKQTFWALKDITFDVNKGEAVGIIGRNGAGKSTLLKVLSRITEPTEGRITLRGRVASLLEVGTGFHPELTGRENIYLNGSVLGMMKKEINSKFDEIVKFSGVETFLDTPVKRYSSGMYVRLAFAVAAHLEPEILLVDEVLSVGDAEFQKKCLGKMKDVSEAGRTVLFVSHNMGAIQNLCEWCILLENGKVRNIGKTNSIVEEYLNTSLDISNTPLAHRKEQKKSKFMFISIGFQDFKGQKLDNLSSGEDISIVLDYLCKDNSKLRNVQITYDITRMGEPFVSLDTTYSENFEIISAKGRITCNIPKLPLLPGYYSINIRAYSETIMINGLTEAITFYVKEGRFFKSGLMPKDSGARILVDHYWELEKR